jgi:hypothetical protein
MNLTLLTQAQQDWDNFIGSLSSEEKKGLINVAESAASNSLHYFAAIKDAVKFDQTINQLSNRCLYDEEIIPTVYNYYVERDMHEIAFDYLQKAFEYFTANGYPIPSIVQEILEASETIKLLSNYRISLERIRNLTPKNIPRVTPEVINDKRELNTFILNEIVQAGRVTDEKREALRQVTHENRYNDFLQAILRMRFAIWGWSIHDQPRMGTSTGGADAGNADLVVQTGGNNIALIEAFILKDFAYTKTHILKCHKYISSISRYYIVVYYFDSAADFETNWRTYKTDILNISYPADFAINSSLGFIDITNQFTDVNNFRIAKTIHDDKYEMFHIMLNLK